MSNFVSPTNLQRNAKGKAPEAPSGEQQNTEKPTDSSNHLGGNQEGTVFDDMFRTEGLSSQTHSVNPGAFYPLPDQGPYPHYHNTAYDIPEQRCENFPDEVNDEANSVSGSDNPPDQRDNSNLVLKQIAHDVNVVSVPTALTRKLTDLHQHLVVKVIAPSLFAERDYAQQLYRDAVQNCLHTPWEPLVYAAAPEFDYAPQ